MGRFFRWLTSGSEWLVVACFRPEWLGAYCFQTLIFPCFWEKCRATVGKPSAPLTIGKGLHMRIGHKKLDSHSFQRLKFIERQDRRLKSWCSLTVHRFLLSLGRSRLTCVAIVITPKPWASGAVVRPSNILTCSSAPEQPQEMCYDRKDFVTNVATNSVECVLFVSLIPNKC